MPDNDFSLSGLSGKVRIRDVALRLFAIRGYAQTPVRLIAEKAHVSLTLLAYHFGNKQGVRDAVERFIVDCFEKEIEKTPPDGGRCSSTDSVERVADGFVRFLQGRPEIRAYVRGAARDMYLASENTALIDSLIKLGQAALECACTDHSEQDRRREALDLFLLAFGPTLLEPLLQRSMPTLFSDGAHQKHARSGTP